MKLQDYIFDKLEEYQDLAESEPKSEVPVNRVLSMLQQMRCMIVDKLY